MPRLTLRRSMSSANDGAMSYRETLDLTRTLSEYYGRLIRQGSVVMVRGVDVRVYNPNTASQDNIVSASGRLCWYAPTGPRKKAWINAFNAVQRLRRMAGLQEEGYDFRVGLGPDVLLDGHEDWPEVAQQAWIRSESDELYLGYENSSDQNSIFAVHNAQLNQTQEPVDPDLNGFGFPFDTPWALGTGDMDFKEGSQDTGFFIEGQASRMMDCVPFSVAHAGSYDQLLTDDFGAVTNAEHIDFHGHSVPVLCGLMGLEIDTTIPDDSELGTEDFGIEVTIDVESWDGIF